MFFMYLNPTVERMFRCLGLGFYYGLCKGQDYITQTQPYSQAIIYQHRVILCDTPQNELPSRFAHWLGF